MWASDESNDFWDTVILVIPDPDKVAHGERQMALVIELLGLLMTLLQNCHDRSVDFWSQKISVPFYREKVVSFVLLPLRKIRPVTCKKIIRPVTCFWWNPEQLEQKDSPRPSKTVWVLISPVFWIEVLRDAFSQGVHPAPRGSLI